MTSSERTACSHAELIDAYVDGAVSGPEREQAKRHLEACAECRDEARGLAALRELLAAERVAPEQLGTFVGAPARAARGRRGRGCCCCPCRALRRRAGGARRACSPGRVRCRCRFDAVRLHGRRRARRRRSARCLLAGVERGDVVRPPTRGAGPAVRRPGGNGPFGTPVLPAPTRLQGGGARTAAALTIPSRRRRGRRTPSCGATRSPFPPGATIDGVP